MSDLERWPSLPLNEWQDTYHTLHMWTQIVGKIRMVLSPPLNHWWHVTLYVNSRGLTTGPVPCTRGIFEIQFDFQNHALEIGSSDGKSASRPLQAEAVADFYAGIFELLERLGIAVRINPMPQEVATRVPFDRDFGNRSYDAEYANRLWRILVSSAKVMGQFRAKFIGKCSPVHFFWRSCDLACSRFSGRAAPPRSGVISGPAYSQEVCSAGFWPGGHGVDEAPYYSYIVPKPAGIESTQPRPAQASWNAQLSEFVLTYDEVRRAASPEETLYEFLESTYEAGARLAKWDRAALEV